MPLTIGKIKEWKTEIFEDMRKDLHRTGIVMNDKSDGQLMECAAIIVAAMIKNEENILKGVPE